MRFQWSKALWPLLALLVPCLVLGTPYENDEWVPGHLIVNFKASVGASTPATLDNGIVSTGIPSVDELLTTYRVYEAKRLIPDGILSRLEFPPDLSRLYLLYIPEVTDIMAMTADFNANSYVEAAEPDLLRKILRNPNDPLWPQWDKLQMGCDVAWDFGTGDSTIIVCAIDTGTDWNHPDLTPNLWVNPGEDLDGDGLPWEWEDIPGDPDDWDRLDNDGNGYVDDLIGWDFIDNISGCATNEDCDDQDNNPFGLEPHGTHTLGLMAARGNNGIGVTGTGWSFTGMAIRAGYLSNDGWGYMPQSATLQAIPYAVAMGAKIITMSYGGPSGGGAEQSVMQAAWNNGALLFGSAGNEPTEQMQYPACHPHVISVASTDNGDRLSSWSNRGTWLDLCAPGGSPGCRSTIIDGYGGPSWQGTSMACPNAGGTAALIWNMLPQLTNVEMETLIFNHCQDISAQNPTINPAKLGHGRISAPLMLGARFPLLSFLRVAITGDNDGDGRLEPGETGDMIITIGNDSSWATAIDVYGHVVTDDPRLIVSDDSTYFGDVTSGGQADNASNPIEISAGGGIDEVYSADLTLRLVTVDGFAVVLDFEMNIGRPPLLFVDDDAGSIYDTQYKADFDCLHVVFDKWVVAVDGPLDATTMSYYDEIFWSCGNEESQTLTEDDQAGLAAFLDGGGKLALIGRLIDRDLRDDDFYTNYLHCATGNLDSLGRQLYGVTDDPVSDGTSVLLIGSCADDGSTHPQSRIVPLEGATAIYTYYEDGRVGAIRYGDSTTYQVVYCAFALEAACGSSGTDHHRVVVRRILEWFRGHSLSVEPPIGQNPPRQYALLGNFPNPFNPTTTIYYEVGAPGHVTLQVYDVLGRLAATLFDGTAQVGTRSIQFNGSSLSSGIYFVQMTAPGFSSAKKMVLLK